MFRCFLGNTDVQFSRLFLVFSEECTATSSPPPPQPLLIRLRGSQCFITFGSVTRFTSRPLRNMSLLLMVDPLTPASCIAKRKSGSNSWAGDIFIIFWKFADNQCRSFAISLFFRNAFYHLVHNYLSSSLLF